ncbi:unnamed protein product [Paramecium primaurelia]|uniref:Uncharacterized protein n=2 Tax=Paramecium TaxID=5884 RepID=A0A8S1UIP0_9CILI|nr:unnamed protein product [Paramecium primaurelia]CAD8164224.1 unnamed protein product [Paramecium pentaurelia]
MSKSLGTPIKLVVIGDGTVGKTCALLTYTTGKFPEDYIPTIFENYSASITIDGKKVNLGLWDTAGQEDFKQIRPLSYPNTDVFLLFFAVNEQSSYINAQQKWYPELRSALNNVPIIIVGSKIDLRQNDNKCVQRESAKRMADQLGCLYLECSAKDKIGLNELFEEAVRTALRSKKPNRAQEESKQNKDKSCQLI